MAVYLDTETSGLDARHDELLEIAIVNQQGGVLVDTLLKPATLTAWPAAEAVHGITPARVAHAPSLAAVAPRIADAVRGQTVVIYNADFDEAFLGDLLITARSVQCCMQAWAAQPGETSAYHGDVQWCALEAAADAVQFDWPGRAHRALPDALACRAVWRYLTEPRERTRVEAIRREQHHEALAGNALAAAERQAAQRRDAKARHMTRFIEHWWLGQYGSRSHWSRHCVGSAAEAAFALIFLGRSLHALALADRFTEHYTTRQAIPDHLKPARYFPAQRWFQAELRPCAAYIGRQRAWPLYPVSEIQRIRAQYPLRVAEPVLAPGESLLTRTALKAAGYSDSDIAALVPVAERQNPHNFHWYRLYQVTGDARPESPGQASGVSGHGSRRCRGAGCDHPPVPTLTESA